MLEVNPEDWRQELTDIKKFFRTFKSALPKELWDEFRSLEKRIGKNG